MACSVGAALTILIAGIILFTSGLTQLVAEPFATCEFVFYCNNQDYYRYTDYCVNLLICGGVFAGIGVITLITGAILFSQAYKNPVQNPTFPVSYPAIQGTYPATVLPATLYQNPAPAVYPGPSLAPIHSQPSGYSGTCAHPCAQGCSHAQVHHHHLPNVENPQAKNNPCTEGCSHA